MKKKTSHQKLVRTTLRLKADLKKEAERFALDEGLTLQEVFNSALKMYLMKTSKKKAEEIVFPNLKLGKMDKITRDDIYGEPSLTNYR